MTIFSTLINKGDILMAEPFLNEPTFKRSVILLTEINKTGSVGFILNKPVEGVFVSDLFKDFPSFPAPVYMGGPVSQQILYYIHSYPLLLKNCLHVIDDLYIGGDFEILKTNIEQGNIATNKIKFFIGYSGWDKKQLEAELKNKDWIPVEYNKEAFFSKKAYNNLWQQLLHNKGGEFAELANYPSDPSLN